MSHIVRTLMLMVLLVGVASEDNVKEKNAVPVVTRKPRAARSTQTAKVSPSAVGTGIKFKVKRQPPTTTAADKKASHMGDAALQRLHISRTVRAVSTSVGGLSEPKRIFRPAGKHEAKHVAYDLDLWYHIDVPDDPEADALDPEAREKKVLAAAGLLKSDPVLSPSLDLVEPDFKASLSYETDDPRLADQNAGHYNLIDLAQGWDLTAGHPDVVVQVIDTGIDQSHPDLKKNYWNNPGETDCSDGVDNDNNGFVDDCNGYNHADESGSDLLGSGSHGTHCAGTIAADNDNGVGVAGVAGGKEGNAGVSLMINTAFGKSRTFGFAEALVYGADNGAHVSSNSWGYTSPGVYGSDELDAIDYADDAGTAVVFAAGNDNSNEDYYPGFYATTIAVAALDSTGKAAYFTNYGSWVDIAGPGVSVLSTVTVEDGEYGYKSGTSMACPHVAGILALGKSFNPDAELELLRECLFSSANDVTSINTDKYTDGLGTGVANVPAFLNCVKPLVPTMSPAPTYSRSPTLTPSPVPTPKPTYSPAPTPMPVACGICDGKLTLEVTTDYYPDDITWALDSDTQSCSGDALSGNGGAWGQSATSTITITDTLCDGISYTWTIYDSYSDGICCAYGEGSYKLLVDGVIVHRSDGQYGSEDSATFIPGVPLPSAVPSPVPTPKPTYSPAPTPMPVACGTCDGTLTLEVTTDDYPSEMNWALDSDLPSCSGDALSGNGGAWGTSATSTITITESLCDDITYAWTIKDSYGDGICCAFGEGSYKLTVNGVIVHRSGGQYSSEESVTFTPGALVPVPSTAPSAAPTPAPSPIPTYLPSPLPTLKSESGTSTCTSLGWNADKYGSKLVCGESDLGLGGCSGKKSWDDAVDFCAAAGARLCTANELEDDEARGTGCNYDKWRVWSSTKCSDNGEYHGVGGSSKKSGRKCWAGSTERLVRCCADEPPAPPKTCATLGWNADKYGSKSVCGESDLGLGGCSGAKSWDDAVDFCAAAGARLCTADELLDDEARGTGCSYDGKLVWSSTKCSDNGKYHGLGGSSKKSGKKCWAGSKKRLVRCCADV